MSELFGILLGAIFLFFPKTVQTGLTDAIKISANSLIPSLFPYILISGIFIKAGSQELISEICYPLLKKILRLSKNGCGGFILSLFCGYPTGARVSAELLKNNKISENEAKRIFFAGNIPGFGFCVSFLNQKYQNGLKIYFSYIIGAFIFNFILSFFLKESKSPAKSTHPLPIYKCITQGVGEATLTMLNLCGFVCFFSCVSSFFKNFMKNKQLFAIVSSFLEISSGSEQVFLYFPKNVACYTTVFFTGFCGLSVMFQSLSFLKEKTNIKLLFVSRFIFALISLVIFILLKGVKI